MTNTSRRKYFPDTDFIRVRDFLVEIFSLSENPLNWKLERWNYARYFITPMLVTDGIGDSNLNAVKAAVQLWNDSTVIWESDVGEITGVVNIEHCDKMHSGWGEVFIQHHPDFDNLLPEMLEYAETYLFNPEKKQVFIPIYEYDKALIAAAQARGYQKNEKYKLWDSVYKVTESIPIPTLLTGYSMCSMADEGSDIDKRRKAFGVGFNHSDPMDWPSRISYQCLQQSPNYRPDLDIYVVAPDGAYVSFCIAWWDEVNQIASLEPVGTAPEYRRKGLARAAVQEAIRSVAELGARRIFVGSDQIFYLAIGFDRALPAHHWVKTIEN